MKTKRIFDVVFSVVGLALLLPLIALVAILVRLDRKGPAFFIQTRIGRNFRPFDLYKFRSMVTDAETKGTLITAGGDPRITRFGRLLRKTKVDELPQLWNVLKGDMSLVGSRPEVEKYVNLFEEDYKEILQVRPGITDISSMIYRDEEQILKDRRDPETYYGSSPN